MEITGKIIKILKTKKFKNNFKKREIIIETDEQYPQFILIEFVQKKIKIIEDYKINDYVKIYINIRGKEWMNKEGEKKYFNSIQGWKIEKINDKLNNIEREINLENEDLDSSLEDYNSD